jgi:hypothetical protein
MWFSNLTGKKTIMFSLTFYSRLAQKSIKNRTNVLADVLYISFIYTGLCLITYMKRAFPEFISPPVEAGEFFLRAC